jgi:uncharacterized protein YcbK (DUF882 family)
MELKNFEVDKLILNRRGFLKTTALTAAALMAPLSLPLTADATAPDTKRLAIFNKHTEEFLDVTYWADGRYLPDALTRLNYILRDHHVGQTKTMDPKLFDCLHAISTKLKLGPSRPFHVISAYRSPKTNAKLRRQNRRVAKNSYHVKGRAVDIRVPGFKTSTLRRAAMRVKMGGVGYYRRSRFVHIDSGAVRYW